MKKRTKIKREKERKKRIHDKEQTFLRMLPTFEDKDEYDREQDRRDCEKLMAILEA